LNRLMLKFRTNKEFFYPQVLMGVAQHFIQKRSYGRSDHLRSHAEAPDPRRGDNMIGPNCPEFGFIFRLLAVTYDPKIRRKLPGSNTDDDVHVITPGSNKKAFTVGNACTFKGFGFRTIAHQTLAKTVLINNLVNHPFILVYKDKRTLGSLQFICNFQAYMACTANDIMLV
jgi:hypothetical protein